MTRTGPAATGPWPGFSLLIDGDFSCCSPRSGRTAGPGMPPTELAHRPGLVLGYPRNGRVDAFGGASGAAAEDGAVCFARTSDVAPTARTRMVRTASVPTVLFTVVTICALISLSGVAYAGEAGRPQVQLGLRAEYFLAAQE
ncbi:hypothetical protein ACFYZI_40790 [Streptomyces griseorubiginosus]|uniref:hypothetical protein n=1 Tax=Streptomyces griseorubiginosus TaxID=67304 RepID=UPI0036AA1375